MSEAPRVTVDVEAVDGRYARQELIAWWDQTLLAQARMLVVGAGALGNELAKSLALLGVGKITLVDFDLVEHSNLSRGVFMREEDVGKAKAIVVAERVRELNPEVEVEALTGDLRVELGVGLVAEFDVVLGGLDSRIARLRLNELARKAGVPYVDGAIEGLMGVARVFDGDSACYECTLSDRALALLNQRRSCALLSSEQVASGRTPTTATSASVIAAIQVQEAIKLLHDAPGADALLGKGYVYNGVTHDSYVVEYAVKEGCLAHDSYDTSRTIPANTTIARLSERAVDELGKGAVVQFEQEIVTRLACPSCETETRPNLIAPRLGTDQIRCAKCGAELAPTLVNRVGDSAPEDLAALRLDELALPPRDVVSLVSADGMERKQFVVESIG